MGDSRQKSAGTLALLLFVLACGVRAWLLVSRPFWHDEIFTAWISRSGLSPLLSILRRDSGPPIYYLLVRPFTAASELWALPDATLRVLSFAAIVILGFGVRSLPRRGRAWFLALCSTSLLLTFYAAEARAYALLALSDFALFLLLRRRGASAVRIAAIALLTAAILYTHYLGVFFVGAVGLVALLERRFSDAGALAAGSALFAPWVPVLLHQPAAATAWLTDVPVRSITGFLSTLAGVGRLPPAFGLPPPAILFWVASVSGLLLLAVVAGASLRNPDLRAGLQVVGLLLLATIVAGAWKPVAFAGRTEMAVLPVWIWTLALAASGEGERFRLARVGAAAACTLGVAAIALTVPTPRVEPPGPRAVAAIAGLARSTDLVVAGTAFYLPSRLARDRGALAAPLQGFPRDIEEHPGWFALAPPPERAYADLRETLSARRPGSRVWLAIHPLFATPRLAAVLEETGRAHEGLRGREALVLVWTAPLRGAMRSPPVSAGGPAPTTDQRPPTTGR